MSWLDSSKRRPCLDLKIKSKAVTLNAIDHRGVAEWSNAAVLKTVVPRGTGGSNPSSSAFKKAKSIKTLHTARMKGFLFLNTLISSRYFHIIGLQTG